MHILSRVLGCIMVLKQNIDGDTKLSPTITSAPPKVNTTYDNLPEDRQRSSFTWHTQ